jgi:glycosyltransferase involved in cell wall biosynthesis
MPRSRLAPPATGEARSPRRAPEGAAGHVQLSVVIPVYDEEDNVRPLYEGLRKALDNLDVASEILVVDDGSRDETYARLEELAASDPQLKLVELRRNFGQTAALAAGFDHASGDVVVSMDGDLQNDPADIPRLLAEIDKGYDVVSGWRRDRHDPWLRTLASSAANRLIGVVTGVRLHDYGCTLKAYRSDIVSELRLYGEMHRFLPALAHQAGAKITEIPVQHHARKHGKSKYGMRRTLKVVLDLMTVKFLSGYASKPSYVFGGAGILLCFGGVVAAVYTAYEKLVRGIYAYRNPALLVGIFLFILGVNMILMGLLAELVVRTHHESQSRTTYSVRELRNFTE